MWPTHLNPVSCLPDAVYNPPSAVHAESADLVLGQRALPRSHDGSQCGDNERADLARATQAGANASIAHSGWLVAAGREPEPRSHDPEAVRNWG